MRGREEKRMKSGGEAARGGGRPRAALGEARGEGRAPGGRVGYRRSRPKWPLLYQTSSSGLLCSEQAIDRVGVAASSTTSSDGGEGAAASSNERRWKSYELGRRGRARTSRGGRRTRGEEGGELRAVNERGTKVMRKAPRQLLPPPSPTCAASAAAASSFTPSSYTTFARSMSARGDEGRREGGKRRARLRVRTEGRGWLQARMRGER